MKLIAKYNRVNIITLVVAMLASATCFYYVVSYLLRDRLDTDLKIEKQEILDQVAKKGTLPEASSYYDQEIYFSQVNSTVREKFSTVNSFDAGNEELIRQLEFPVKVKDQLFKVTIRKSQEHTESLISLIVISTLAIILLMLISLFLINRLFFRQLWQPFNTALLQIKRFNLTDKVSFQPQQSDVNEFNELNASLATMAKTIARDYTALKDFTENASHEIQTPLAIIRSKLEMMMQIESINEQQMADLTAIAAASDRLSRLNRSLILLTRIDNRQFREIEPVDLQKLVDKEMSSYEELLGLNKIDVIKQMPGVATKVSMNLALAETLVSNLVTNAIKHNIKNGSIRIILNETGLVFENTGSRPDTNPEIFFERFKTGTTLKDSLGLGLSIVKKICDLYQFKVNYIFREGQHRIEILF